MKINLSALGLCCMLLCVQPLYAQQIADGRVFMVASYEQQQVCSAPQEQGVMKGLVREGWFEGENLHVKRFYMDTKRKYTSPEAMQHRGEIALALIRSFKPDVVVTLDDNAFREVGLKLAGSDIPVVFSGMNGQPESYNLKKKFMVSRQQPGGNISGVYEKLYVVRSLKVIAAALPKVKPIKAVGITDYSPTGNAITRQLELELRDKPAEIGWEMRRAHDWQEYRQIIAELNRDPKVSIIYPIALSLKSSDGRAKTAPEIFKWTTEHNLKPEMPVNYFFAKLGLFGGAAVDFQAMGRVAGSYAGKILAGASVGELPIVDAPDYAIVFNVTRARSLNIEIPSSLLTAADHVYR
ncbi:MAG: hypothetical protein L3J63_01860 [Geopsychrobacter sp.]|nr:hypothetical protein [Geopsychrobacter sp.]